jgi:outer membrane protein TolC
MNNTKHSIIYKSKEFLLLGISIFIFQSTLAQQTLNLKQCIETGLEKNFDLRIAKNNQQISDNNLSAGNAGMLPNIDFLSTHTGSLTDKKQLPVGSDIITEINNVNDYGFDVGVNLNWTVFDGFNMFTNYKRLKEMQVAGELSTRLSIESYIANVSGEYFNFVQQNLRFNNLKSALALSRERLRIVESRYRIGSLSRLDLMQAKVDFNADSSKLLKQHEILFGIRVKLNQLMASTDVENQFAPKDTDIHFNSLLNKSELWESVLKSNTLLLLAQNDKKISMLDLKSYQSKYYPYLKFNSSYGYSTDRFGASTLRRQDVLGLNYGLTLGFNIFDGFNRNRQQQNAKITIENKALEIENLELSLKSDFSNIWKAYQNNMELTLLEKENLQNAKVNYEIAIDRYKLGNLSGVELREAQNSLLDAEERLIEAQLNTKLSEITLLQLSGRLNVLVN